MGGTYHSTSPCLSLPELQGKSFNPHSSRTGKELLVVKQKRTLFPHYVQVVVALVLHSPLNHTSRAAPLGSHTHSMCHRGHIRTFCLQKMATELLKQQIKLIQVINVFISVSKINFSILLSIIHFSIFLLRSSYQLKIY